MTENPTWRWKVAQSLEYKWWQRYLHNKDTKEYLSWKYHYWQDLLLKLTKYIELPQSKSILDAGCGPAGIFMALKGNSVDAIDPLLDKYDALPHFTKDKYLWTHFQNQSIEQIDATEKYDIIYCMNAINHVENIELCYDNLVRALKPNGYLIISTDAHKHEFLKKIFQLIPGDILHPYQFNLQEYDAFLTKRNCEIVHDILSKEERIFNYYITVARKK